MALSVSNENKNNVTVANEAKQSNSTWAQRSDTWAQTGPGGDTWGVPGTVVANETKNNVSVTNENKN